jgi:putative transposase
MLVFHPQSAGSATDVARRSHRCAAAGVRGNANEIPFDIAAIVVLPDHLHAIWTLPPDDADFSTRWRLIKTRFAKSLPRRERRSAVRKARGERGIWQRRFWEHLIRDDADYARHVEYCYFNPIKHCYFSPIKHGHARRARDWPHSSFHRDVRHGLFPLDWAGEVAPSGSFAERGP